VEVETMQDHLKKDTTSSVQILLEQTTMLHCVLGK